MTKARASGLFRFPAREAGPLGRLPSDPVAQRLTVTLVMLLLPAASVDTAFSV
jgi:hypothetical protein